MWTCPKCNRRFRSKNQSHMCVVKDIGELFLDKPDELVLAYDTLENHVMQWQPNSFGPSTHAIVFTNSRAWLIVKPMKNKLDLKFYFDEKIEHELIAKVSRFGKKFGHHIRIESEDDLTSELFELLKIGFDFGLRD